MNKLSSYNYDILDYVLSGDLEKIASTISGLSKEAQTATIPDFEESQSRPNKDFALVTYHPVQGEIKKFAKHSKELTEINLAFLNESLDELPDEIVKVASQNLKQAAKDWGLELPSKIANLETEDGYCDPVVALNDIDEYSYAVKLSEASSQTYALPDKLKYPITNRSDISRAIDYFEKHAHQFEPAEAIEFARNVERAAKDYEISTSDSNIEKFANLNLSKFNEDFELHVRGRERYLKEEDREIYQDIIKIASDHSPTKVAKVLESCDVKLGLDEHWGAGIANPAISVFSGLEKKANQSGPTLEELRSLDRGVLTGLVGTDAVGDLLGEEGVDVYHTLPRPIKKEIDALLG